MPIPISAKRLFACMILVLAVLLGPGMLIAFWVFLYTGPFNLINLHLGHAGTLGINTGLSLLFFVQHSVMVRPFFRRWLARFMSPSFVGALYAISSGSALLVLMLFWQESSMTILSFDMPLSFVFRAGYFVSLIGFAWCIHALGLVDPFGLTAVVAYLRGTPEAPPAFTVRGPYTLVRHPVYFFSILILWSYPHLTADRMLLNVTWTLWIITATFLEERDLAATLGEKYRDYQAAVPMLIPRRNRKG